MITPYHGSDSEIKEIDLSQPWSYNKKTKRHECRIEKITKRITNQIVEDNKRITNGQQIELLTILRDGERPMTELMAHFGYKKRESLK